MEVRTPGSVTYLLCTAWRPTPAPAAPTWRLDWGSGRAALVLVPEGAPRFGKTETPRTPGRGQGVDPCCEEAQS